MAVSNIYRRLIFGSVDSADYDIYISGDGVYNAPERAVELVSVPGRNGAIAIDGGHWENIEIEYPAGSFGTDQTEFAEKLTEYRNALASQIGYQRLQDTYHPEEYRVGMFIAGLEVEPVAGGKAGEFKLIFNCKPQRFLTSGETPQTVADGDTLTNPTQYDAQPLLAITGNGAVSFNNYTVNVDAGLYGEITLAENERQDGTGYSDRFTFRVDAANANPGDALTVTMAFGWDLRAISGARFTNIVNTTAPSKGTPYLAYGNNSATIMLTDIPYTCAVGNASSAETVTTTFSITYTQNGSTYTRTMTLTATFTYSAGNVVRFEVSATFSGGGSSPMASSPGPFAALMSAVADSTKSYLGDPTYIDCESGEAYKVEDDTYYSLNRYIALGSDLPTLAPGTNTFEVDNTITELKVTPRWWRL